MKKKQGGKRGGGVKGERVGVAQSPQRELPTGSARALGSSRSPPSQGFLPPPGQKRTEPSTRIAEQGAHSFSAPGI